MNTSESECVCSISTEISIKSQTPIVYVKLLHGGRSQMFCKSAYTLLKIPGSAPAVLLPNSMICPLIKTLLMLIYTKSRYGPDPKDQSIFPYILTSAGVDVEGRVRRCCCVGRVINKAKSSGVIRVP